MRILYNLVTNGQINSIGVNYLAALARCRSNIVAKSLVEWFENEENKKILSELFKYIEIENPKVESGIKIFYGKTFVLTGTMEKLSRIEAEEKIRSLGGDVSSSVSKKTTYVVAGENAGTKLEKAREIGIQVLTEDGFLKML